MKLSTWYIQAEAKSLEIHYMVLEGEHWLANIYDDTVDLKKWGFDKFKTWWKHIGSKDKGPSEIPKLLELGYNIANLKDYSRDPKLVKLNSENAAKDGPDAAFHVTKIENEAFVYLDTQVDKGLAKLKYERHITQWRHILGPKIGLPLVTKISMDPTLKIVNYDELLKRLGGSAVASKGKGLLPADLKSEIDKLQKIRNNIYAKASKSAHKHEDAGPLDMVWEKLHALDQRIEIYKKALDGKPLAKEDEEWLKNHALEEAKKQAKQQVLKEQTSSFTPGMLVTVDQQEKGWFNLKKFAGKVGTIVKKLKNGYMAVAFEGMSKPGVYYKIPFTYLKPYKGKKQSSIKVHTKADFQKNDIVTTQKGESYFVTDIKVSTLRALHVPDGDFSDWTIQELKEYGYLTKWKVSIAGIKEKREATPKEIKLLSGLVTVA